MENNQIYDVFTTIESNKEDVKDLWNKIGTGLLNRDGSINVILDAYPANGRLQIRIRRDKEKSEQDSEEDVPPPSFFL